MADASISPRPPSPPGGARDRVGRQGTAVVCPSGTASVVGGEPQTRDGPQGQAKGRRGGGQGRLLFLREFLRAPGQLGSMFTSSRALARAMVEHIGIEQAGVVIELGPGPGPVTEQILARIPPGCRFLAIERNAELAAALRRRFPALDLIEDDAANLLELCRQRDIGPGSVDCVVSGLPFLLFPRLLQRRILSQIVAVLRPGGWLSQVTLGSEMLPATRRFRCVLEHHFVRVERAGPVLTNLPPAFVYRCQKDQDGPRRQPAMACR